MVVSKHQGSNKTFPKQSLLGDEGAAALGDLPTLVHRLCAHGSGEISVLPAYTMILDQDFNDVCLSFGELDARARAIAERIIRKGGRGERVLIALDPGLDYIASLYGCMYAGAVAVPVYPPSMLRLQHTLSRLQAIVHDADAALMLSSRSVVGDAVSPLWCLEQQAVIAVDEMGTEAASNDRQLRMPSPDDLALLQYTSGSTGTPRGVALTHANLMHNLAALVKHYHFPGAKALHWLPPYHDMGLVGGILLPCYEGVEAIFMPPKDFISNPIHWLRAFGRYQASSTGSPNFGYELCVRKVRPEQCEGLDLSSWKVAVTGAEPVRASTLDRFCEKFEPYGFDPTAFSPALGMAESTVIVTGCPRVKQSIRFEVDSKELAVGRIETVSSKSSGTQTLMSSGEPVSDMEVEIVHPSTCKKCKPGEIGEIWVRGPSVASGYWNQPEKTHETFAGTICDSGETGYLRTGDLGCLVDGELIVTGRHKELIIIGGRNLYPHDIETVVQRTSDAFRPDTGVAFAVEEANEERLVVVQEVWRPKKYDIDTLTNHALDAIASTFEVTPYAIVFVKTGSLPKTSSGKLRRSDSRAMFLEGEFSELHRWQADGGTVEATGASIVEPETSTEIALASVWRSLLALDDISRDSDFFALGGQSLLVGQLVAVIRDQFQVEISLSSLFGNSTLQQLAKLIDDSPVLEQTGSDDLNADFKIQASESYPLSSVQQRFYLLNEFQQQDAFLCVPISIELAGDVESAKIEDALNKLCAKYSALRTAIEECDGIPVQCVQESVRLKLRCEDKSIELPALRRELAAELSDLARAPLVRAALVQFAPGRWTLEIVLHHIICDAGSIEILLNDLAGELTENDANVPYVSFACWEQADAQRAKISSGLEYWKARLDGLPERLGFPKPHRDESQESESNEAASEPLVSTLGQPLVSKIEAFARRENLLPSSVFLAAYQFVISRYTNSADVPIAIPTTNRPSAKLSDTIGCFINPVVYRGSVVSDVVVSQFVHDVQDMLVDDLDHANVPFQDVVSVVDHERSIDYMPLAQNMFLYQQGGAVPTTLCGAKVQSVTPDYSGVGAYDLSLVVHPGTDTRVVVSRGRAVDERCALGVMNHFRETLEAIVEKPGSRVNDLPARPRSEMRETSSTDANLIVPDEIDTVLMRLAKHVSADGDRVAIVDDHATATFLELDERSSVVARSLMEIGLQPDGLVGLHLTRSIDMVVAMLGVWKAGGAYVPLDPSLPAARKHTIVDDARLALMITDFDNAFEHESVESKTIADLLAGAGEFPLTEIARSRLAYVIYTSGSTGTPKGVAIEHGSVANLLQSFASRPGFTADDSILALTTTSFDISVLELFLPIWVGGTVRLTAMKAADESDELARIIAEEKITCLQTTPSTLRVLRSSGWSPRENLTVLCGGEPMMPDLAEDLVGCGVELWNVYGPTETTVWSSVAKIDDSQITIGRPIENTSFHVLDDQLRPLPIGVAGEICISGAGLARGYWNDTERTADRFPVVILDGKETRIYRTGDLGRGDLSGTLHHLGRNDRQIKLRGFRIELNEIEAALLGCDGVDEAAVVLRSHGAEKIVAFLVGTWQETDVIQELRSKLPLPMVPTVFCEMQAIPKNAAGKIDYRSLPKIQQAAQGRDDEAPQTPLEQKIASIWCDVLRLDKVGRDVNFFRAGGDSLQAAQLFSRLKDQVDADIPLRRIYDSPTVMSIANVILERQLALTKSDVAETLDQLEGLSEEEVHRALERYAE